MLADIQRKLVDVVGKPDMLKSLTLEKYVDDRFGLPTVRDIVRELEKPGRDPRPEFKTASFRDGIEKLTDLEPGMVLEGTVTNVAAFGAFVDIGVHQDGLVHISQLSDKFVKDPREVVSPGDRVQAKVLAVNLDRKQISLTLRLSEEAPVRRPKADVAPGSPLPDRPRPAEAKAELKPVDRRWAGLEKLGKR